MGMSEFEQMMAEIHVPEEVALQISKAASNGEILRVWNELVPAVDKVFGNCNTADATCALSMLVAYIAEKLAKQIKFGESPEDEGEAIHPNFAIMAIALMAVQTYRRSVEAREKEQDDGEQEKGKQDKRTDDSGGVNTAGAEGATD
jgi:hypothetical protein